jgi:hypothetical protein
MPPRTELFYVVDMGLRPLSERSDRLGEAAAEFRQLVVDPGWDRGVDGTGDEPVGLETTQRLGQHLPRNSLDAAAQIRVPHGALKERVHDQDGPLAGDVVEDLAS